MSDEPIDLKAEFPDLKPIKSAPSLFTLNGFGFMIYGKRDYHAPTQSYIKTHCLCAVFIPIVALGAYRVIDNPQGGWFFLGREKLSRVVKVWNQALGLALLTLVLMVGYEQYTSTPEYQARKQMATAAKLIGEGNVSEAARRYETLVVTHTPEEANATNAMRDLLVGPANDASMDQLPEVYRCAGVIVRRGNGLTGSEVQSAAIKLVRKRGTEDAKSAVGVLDVVAPLVTDTRPLDETRLPLLTQWAQREPTNLDAIIPLAAALEKQDKLDDAVSLLMPVKDRLGDGEGARVMGLALARRGDVDGALPLLTAYVRPRIDRLHVAEKDYNDTLNRLWEQELDILRNNQGPQSLYKRIENAGDAERNAAIAEYVGPRIKQKRELIDAETRLTDEARVVPVTLETGMLMLQSAQSQTDAAERQKRLEETEKVFLSIGGIASESDVYRLSLGQVYYWLGKHDEGRKLFDEYMTANASSAASMIAVAGQLRTVGAVPEARAMFEKAYHAATNTEDRHHAAAARAISSADLDDEIEWLKRANTDSPRVKASLEKALGDKAAALADDATAAAHYRAAIESYAKQTRSDSSLNDLAIAYSSLYGATGDAESLRKSVEHFQQAVDLNPSDPILTYNAGITIYTSAISDIIGTRLDLRQLQSQGAISHLGYLYRDAAQREPVIAQLKSHPGMTRAIDYLEKVTILAPKNPNAYSVLLDYYDYIDDDRAVLNLAERFRANGPDVSDSAKEYLDYVSGKDDARHRSELAANVRRAHERAERLRPRRDATAAVALVAEVSVMGQIDAIDDPVDLAQMLGIAEEAKKYCDSSATHTSVLNARLAAFRKHAISSDPELAAVFKKYARTLSTRAIIALVLRRDGALRDRLIKDPRFADVLGMLVESVERFPASPTVEEMEYVRAKNPDAARKMLDQIRADEAGLAAAAMDASLHPSNLAYAVPYALMLEARGRRDEAKAVLAAASQPGVEPPALD